jgi:hypothetical protein
MGETALGDCHVKSVDWIKVRFNLPDGIEEWQDWTKCSEPNCERYYGPSRSYFSTQPG